MSLIQIGTTTAGKPVKLDLPTLLRTHLQIQGASGSGKSWLVRLLAEQLFGKVPVIIIDQEGEYATLREKFDYILVGKGGETPTVLQSAGLLAHRLLELRASAVVDLYDLDIPNRKTWLRRFFEGVMSAPKELWRPTVFIIDEAHDFIPEKAEAECASILASAISKGRKRGFAFVCATQRLSKLNKDVASELQNVLIGKTWLDIDRERGASALGIYASKEKQAFFDECKRLDQGSFFAQGAAISLDRVLLQTGPIQTTHPDSSNVKNKKTWLVPPPTPKAVQQLLGKLGDLPKEAELEAATVSDLKHQVVQLKHELKVFQKAPKQVLPAGISGGTPDKKLEHIQKESKALQKEVDAIKLYAETLAGHIRGMHTEVAKAAELLVRISKERLPKKPDVKHVSFPVFTPKVHVQVQAPVYNKKVQPVAQTQEDGESDISNKQRDILRALSEFRAIGREIIPRTWVAARAGASHRSSAFANNVSNLRTRGLIEYTGDGIRLTSLGVVTAPVVDSPLTNEEMLHSCLHMVGNKQGAILAYLHSIHPDTADRETVAQNAGASPNSSAYANNVSALKSAGMITYQPDRTLRAADWLFID